MSKVSDNINYQIKQQVKLNIKNIKHKHRLTSVRTISHRADSSSDLLRIHSSTSGCQCSGISNTRDRFDFDTEDPGVDGLEI